MIVKARHNFPLSPFTSQLGPLQRREKVNEQKQEEICILIFIFGLSFQVDKGCSSINVGKKYFQVRQTRTDVTSFCMQLEMTWARGVWTDDD